MLRSILQSYFSLEVGAEMLACTVKQHLKAATCDPCRAYLREISEETIRDSTEIKSLRADVAAIRAQVDELKESKVQIHSISIN